MAITVAGRKMTVSDALRQYAEEKIGNSMKVMDMIMLIQYIDTLKEIGANSKSNVVFVPHTPGNVSDISEQIRETVFADKLSKD